MLEPTTVLIGLNWLKQEVWPSLGWSRWKLSGGTQNLLRQERLRLILETVCSSIRLMGVSPASLCAAGSNDLPGPTTLPMTEFEGSPECPCWKVPDLYNVGRLTGVTLNLTRQIGWMKRAPLMESVWQRFGRFNSGIGYDYGGKTMEMTQTDELDW